MNYVINDESKLGERKVIVRYKRFFPFFAGVLRIAYRPFVWIVEPGPDDDTRSSLSNLQLVLTVHT